MIKVAKFGGSSLACADNIIRAAEIVLSDEDRRYIVVSAPGKWNEHDEKLTDMLYHAYIEKSEAWTKKAIKRLEELSVKLGVDVDIPQIFDDTAYERGMEFFVSRGEYACGLIFSKYIGYEFIDAAEIIFFHKDGSLDGAKTNAVLRKRLEKCRNAVIPGFYGSLPNGDVKTFSRGGSDITGAIVAGAARADVYENWTDVDGFMLADPEIVGENKNIKNLSYRQLQGLSKMGAGIIHPHAVSPVCGFGIPVSIKNTFAPEKDGTYIEYSEKKCREVTGITGKRGYCTFVVEDFPCSVSNIISEFLKNRAEIERIQACGSAVLITVSADSVEQTRRNLLFSLGGKNRCAYIVDGTALVFVSAKNIKNNFDIVNKTFSALLENEIPLIEGDICQTDGSLTVVIKNEGLLDLAIQVIYNTLKSI